MDDLPVAGWKDGKAVWIPADETPVDIEESGNPWSYPVSEIE